MNLPTQLQQRGIYYGWIILCVGTLGVIMSIPGQTMGISGYTDFLLKAHELSRTELSLVSARIRKRNCPLQVFRAIVDLVREGLACHCS